MPNYLLSKLILVLLPAAAFWLAPDAVAADAPPWSPPDAIEHVDVQKLDVNTAVGLTITSVVPDGAADQAGVAAGDLLVAIDGYRIYDLADYRFFLNFRIEGPEAQDWSLVRDGKVVNCTVRNWRPTGLCGVNFISNSPKVLAEAAEIAGVEMSGVQRLLLELVPGRATQVIRNAQRSSAAPPPDNAWIAEFLKTSSAVHETGAKAALPAAVPIPDKFVAGLDRFYRAVAADRERGRQDPDPQMPQTLGVDAYYMALYYPYPASAPPEVGDVQVKSDEFLQEIKKWRDGGDNFAQRRALAMRLQIGGNNADLFVSEVEAAILDPEMQGGWPFRSVLIYGEQERAEIIAELRKRIDAKDDATMAACALTGPLVLNHDVDGAVAAIESVATKSPWLAQRALTIAANSARHYGWRDVESSLSAHFTFDKPLSAPPPFSRIYVYCLARNAGLRRYCALPDYSPGGFASTFRNNAALIAAILEPDGAFMDRISDDMRIMRLDATNLASTCAFSELLADPKEAAHCCDTLQWLGLEEKRMAPEFNRRLDVSETDAVAGCFARMGDFEKAQLWEKTALQHKPAKSAVDFAGRLASYARGEPVTVNQPGAVPFRNKGDDGAVEEGKSINGVLVGPFSRYRADGSKELEGTYLDSKAQGHWRLYGKTGKLAEEGYFIGGQPTGDWRIYDENGALVGEGRFRSPGVRVGIWKWRNADGSKRAQGLYVAGKRAGTWTAWDAKGAIRSQTRYTLTDPQENFPADEIVDRKLELIEKTSILIRPNAGHKRPGEDDF